MRMRDEETKWWNPRLSLPTQEELIPISQTLIPTNLAVAFDIIPPIDPSLKRPRLVWTPQLHRRFVDAVVQLGIRNAVPKTIMQMMSVEGLTRENIASHLQKYRQYLKRIGSGLAGGDPAMDRLFSSSPVPAMFLQQSRENLSPFSTVGAVGDLGFRGVAGNGSLSNDVSDHSFLMGQSHISRENLSHFPPVGGPREQQGVFRGVAGNGSVSNGVSDRSFLIGQSQQSISSRENFSHMSSVGAPQELGFQQGGFRGVAGNGFVSISGLDHSFLMSQSQQNGRSRDDLLPFSAVGMVRDQGFQQGGYTGMGGTGSGSNRLLDRSFLMGRSQVYASSPMYVDDMMNEDSGGARRVLTLFPTGEDD